MKWMCRCPKSTEITPDTEMRTCVLEFDEHEYLNIPISCPFDHRYGVHWEEVKG